MLFRNTIKTSFCKLQKQIIRQNKTAAKIVSEKCNIEKIRNIGILAHIDAGKTTTTERMLYYSGSIRQMGEVHDGNTVTDFMDQERERGITICSAAVTFDWKKYQFNLIDTPGHIDFTMGVEQTIGVLDGVVVVLDGSAGVEAQTSTVWRQANRYNLPRIVYVNKMDRQNANFEMCLKSLESKLEAITLPVHIPYKDKNELVGLVDLITLEKIIFDKKTQGRTLLKTKLINDDNKNLLENALEKRRHLTDKLSGLDDNLANIVIEKDSLDNISPQALVDSLRRITISRTGVPVMLGSSYKNIGVQSLMDGIILYLPSPDYNQYSKLYKCFGNNLSARVFKIVHDKQRGPITFFRIYTGTMTKSQKLYNIQREQIEQGGKLYAAYADDYEEIPEIGEGNIAALTGLKHTITGDLLTNNVSVVNHAKKYMEKKNFTTEEIEKLFSIGTNIPDPVFFCSVEPPSLSYVKALEEALHELEKEDPSLRVTQDTETGQTVLAGMGELHIDIIKERIRSEYKIDVELGELQIAYKETIENVVKDTHTVCHEIGNTKHEVTVTLSLIPNFNQKEQLLLDKSRENAANIASIHPKIMTAVKRGVTSALIHGPKLGCPIVNVAVKLHWLEVKRGTSDSIVSATVSQCIKKLMDQNGSILLEPIMNMEVVTLNDSSTSNILGDLTKRRAEIKSIDIRGQNKIILCVIPLAELLGYATQLRILSSGTATFSMEFSHYKPMSSYEEQDAIKKVTGF